MAKSKAFFEEYKPHSRHKLLILKSYFESWGFKLGLRAGAGTTLLYVDACAGAGQDDKGNPGSPLIAAKAAIAAQASISQRRGEPMRLQIIAIEKDRARHSQLTELLEGYPNVETRLGTLDEYIDGIERDYGTCPWLFFIDPFGIDPLRAGLVRRAIAGPQHETLLLFAGGAAIRHFGALDDTDTAAERRRDRFNVRSAQVSLFDDDNERVETARQALSARAQDSRASRDSTAVRSQRILDAAYDGTEWLPIINATPRAERHDKLLELYLQRLEAWGAEYRLPIPILNREGTQVYTLIHTSHSAVGHRTMKQAVEYALRKTELPPEVAEQMRERMRTDVAAIVADVGRRFAGEKVRWAEDPENSKAPCVKHYALEETPLCCCDEPALKTALKPFQLPGRTIAYSFPALS